MLYNPALNTLIAREFSEFVKPSSEFAKNGPEFTERWDHLILAFLSYCRQEIKHKRMVPFTIRKMRQKSEQLRISITEQDWNARACIDLLSNMTAVGQAPVTEGEALYRQLLSPFEDVYDCSVGVGSGWYALLMGLGAICVEDDSSFRDVKEKYGELSLFPNANSARCEYACDFAEFLSGFICDICGKAGHSRESGWVVTRCDQHA
ncbi:hypothetical protein I5S53_12130 [Pseudomonas juntendi]|uniref:hypothetical protein n=1 Tax=Pseudomonas juntendi TaxID=2666183 RepID=UPI0018D9970B|nr:hypothetical protein [Pseudomonas juntendi]MBH3384709.1 hypothetical protein [Pseudomonas juntendi]